MDFYGRDRVGRDCLASHDEGVEVTGAIGPIEITFVAKPLFENEHTLLRVTKTREHGSAWRARSSSIARPASRGLLNSPFWTSRFPSPINGEEALRVLRQQWR
jgi:hypothetical protein